MTHRPNAGAGGGCYLFSFEVRMRQGRVTLPCKSLRGVRAPNSQCTQRVQICENLISFSSSWDVFVIFLTDSFTVSFIANLVQVNCLYAANYISIVR